MILGTYKREYPRGYVMRGWDPQNPSTLTSALPVAVDPDTAQLYDIQPGMVISTNSTGDAWQLGGTGSLIAVAQDGVERWDVMAADSLVGLLCSGKFRFATPFFARYAKNSSATSGAGTAAVYTAGTPLTFCADTEFEYARTGVDATDGSLTPVKRSLKGFIRPAVSGETVIGYVAETHSGLNRAAAYSTETAVPARADQESIGKAVDSTAKFTNAYMVIWDSSLAPSAPTE